MKVLSILSISALAFIAYVLISHTSLFASPREDVNAVIGTINKYFSSLKSSHGSFNITNGRNTDKGEFFFKAPDKFKMTYAGGGAEISKRRIISNGKKLWVYIPNLNSVIDQDLNKVNKNSIESFHLGVERLVTKYNSIDFKNKKNDFVKEKDLDEKTVILELTEPIERSSFETMHLYVQENGFIAKVVGINDDKKSISLSRNDVKDNEEIEDKEFEMRPPENAYFYKNPVSK